MNEHESRSPQSPLEALITSFVTITVETLARGYEVNLQAGEPRPDKDTVNKAIRPALDNALRLSARASNQDVEELVDSILARMFPDPSSQSSSDDSTR